MGTIDRVKTLRRIVDTLWKTKTAGQLEEIAKILTVEVAYLPLPEFSPMDFDPDQVRCMCQLRVGFNYRRMYEGGSELGRVFTLLEEPFLNEDMWWMKITCYYDNGSPDYVTTISLADAGVVPYSNGTWNQANYIIFTEESRHLQQQYCCCHQHTHHHHQQHSHYCR